jgi:esterase/lipase superfamily enzyme/uncharacterized protein YjbI with pentapeptide repeats
MADLLTLERLRLGAKAWNAWRTANRAIRPDLARADLSERHLESYDLTRVDLREARLSRARLVEVDLSGADLTGVDLTEARLRSSRLVGANLSASRVDKASFERCDCSGASFVDVHGEGASFPLSNLAEADLTRAELSGANFLDAHLNGATLTQAQLPHAKLTNADLQHADLSSANLNNAQLGGATTDATVLRGADLRGVSFRVESDDGWDRLANADLSRAVVHGPELFQTRAAWLAARGAIVDGEPRPDPLPGSSQMLPSRSAIRRELLEDGLLTEGGLLTAIREMERSFVTLAYALVDLGLVEEGALTSWLAEQYRVPAVDVDRLSLSPDLLRLIPASLAKEKRVLPVKRDRDSLTVATVDPFDVLFLDDLRHVTGHHRVTAVLAGEHALRRAIERAYQWAASSVPVADLREESTGRQGPDSPASVAGPGVTDAEGARDNRTIRLWFGTNRRPRVPGDPYGGYTEERDSTVHHGTSYVHIPKSHRIGSLGSPFWIRWFRGFDDRVTLKSIAELVPDDFWELLREAVSAEPGDGVVFLHGYNVSFEAAALRAGQLAADLDVAGPMAFFSWPSKASVVGYLADGASIEASEEAITGFLTDFATRAGVRRVHVIAHSMGNRGLLRAVQRIVATAGERSEVRFGQIILAAPDVDAETFRRLATAYARIAERTTLYVSDCDEALRASGMLHDYPRAGFAPPVTIVEGIDTIYVGGVDLSFLGHGYVGSVRTVLNDMFAMLTHGHPPEQRMGLASQSEGGGRFWIMRT